MALPQALRDLPGEMIPQGLVGAGGREREVAALLFEQRRCESLAYCRTMAAVYALHRAMYADGEAEFLSQPADFGEIVAARRRLAAAEIALQAQVSVLLRVGPSAARHAIETAVGLIERLPRVFALIGAGVISPKAGEAALVRSRALSAEQVVVLDARLSGRLAAEHEVLSLPALREEVDLLVKQIDAEAAERRRQQAIEDRRITFRPEADGMMAAFALAPAHEGRELSGRLEHIARTVCEGDPRTITQRQTDGLMQLSRGFSTLGCLCDTEGCRYREARYHGEPDADGVVTRFVTLVNVVLNERDLAGVGSAPEPAPELDPGAVTEGATITGGSDPANACGYLVGHGPISIEYARELAARDNARVRPFGRRIEDGEVATALLTDLEAGARTGGAAAPMCGQAVDFAAAWAEIIVRLGSEHDGNGGDGGWFGTRPGTDPDTGPPDSGPPDNGPPDSGLGGTGRADRGPGGAGSSEAGRGGGEARPAGRGGAEAASSLVTARGSTGYRPSVDLLRYVRLLYPRCVFPFCGRPASRAQIDHRQEYDHREPALGGPTTAEGLQPLCVAHHQLKTAGEWIDARLADGRVLWTSPFGGRFIVDPRGTMLRQFPDLERVRWVAPNPTTDHAAPSKPGGRTRLQREHARRERLRRRHVTAMEAELSATSAPTSAVEVKLAAMLGEPRAPRPQLPDHAPPPF